MDEIDNEIIQILKQDGRTAYCDIGKKVGLSEGAVRIRVKRLTESGVIRRFTVETKPLEGAEALCLVSVDPSVPTSIISAVLRGISGIQKVYEVTGEYDVAVVISSSGIAEVNECVEKIRKIDGILDTNTMIVLRSW